MTYEEAISILITAADVRREQWLASMNEELENVVDELYEASCGEAELMACMIDTAIEVVHAAR
jgi:hypothetical protein